MKYILILLLIVAGYFYSQNYMAKDVYTTDFREVMKNFDSTGATKDAVIGGANNMVNSLCNDVSYQVAGGSTVASCLSQYKDAKDHCENSVFELAPIKFTNRDEVVGYLKQFMKCVGDS